MGLKERLLLGTRTSVWLSIPFIIQLALLTVIDTEIITLTRFLNEEQVKHKEATGDFTYDHSHAFAFISRANNGQVFSATLSSLPSKA